MSESVQITRWPLLSERFPKKALALVLNGARARGWDPDGLLGHIASESGFDPAAKNPHASASGLIQVTDQTARALGFRDAAQVRGMSSLSQVRDVVFPFFEMMGGPYRSLGDYKIAGFGQRPTVGDGAVVVPAEHVGINPGFQVDPSTGAVLAGAVRAWASSYASRYPIVTVSGLGENSGNSKKTVSSAFGIALGVLISGTLVSIVLWRATR